MSNSVFHLKPRSTQYAKSRLKSRSGLGSTGFSKKSRVKLPAKHKDILEFLLQHGICEFHTNSYPERIQLLMELVVILKETKCSVMLQNNLFEQIFLRIHDYRFADEYQVRALTYRIIRLLTASEKHVLYLLRSNFFVSLIRALEFVDFAEAERLESLKFVALILSCYYRSSADFKRLIVLDERFSLFFRSVLQNLVSIALDHLSNGKDGADNPPSKPCPEDSKTESQNHRLSFVALSILLEAAVMEPIVVVDVVGTSWLVQCFNSFYSINVRVACIVHQVLIKWLDSPKLRQSVELDLVLQQIFSSLIDLAFFHQPPKEIRSSSFFRIAEGLESCAHTFTYMMRSWSGMLACTAVDDQSPFFTNARFSDASLLQIFPYIGLNGLPNVNLLKLRDVVVEACCECLAAPYAAKSFTDWNEAVSFYAQMHVADGYRFSLRDDFVVAEINVLMNMELSYGLTDLLSAFRMLTAFLLISGGVIQMLCRLIVANPSDPISFKATLLLADFLNTGSTYLPQEWRLRSVAVPALMRAATQAFIIHSSQRLLPLDAATTAVTSSDADASTIKLSHSAVAIGDGVGSNAASHPQQHQPTVVDATSDAAFLEFQRQFCGGDGGLDTLSENIENALQLLNRLDQLNEIANQREHADLLSDLNNINLFCFPVTSQKHKFTAAAAEFSGSADTSVSEQTLEQYLSDVQTKLFSGGVNAVTTSSTSLIWSNSGSATSDDLITSNAYQSQQQHQHSVDRRINWRYVDQVLQLLEDSPRELAHRSRIADKCQFFFTHVTNYFMPSNQCLVRDGGGDAALYVISVGRRAFHLAGAYAADGPLADSRVGGQPPTFMSSVQLGAMTASGGGGAVGITPSMMAVTGPATAGRLFHADLLRIFAADFCTQIMLLKSGATEPSGAGPFALKNLFNSNAPYYFSFVQVLSAWDIGYRIMEGSGLLQLFFDFVLNAECAEYVKLIVSCLDFSRPGICRGILQTALSSSDKRIRKWSTRFLNVLIGLGDRWHQAILHATTHPSAANTIGGESGGGAELRRRERIDEFALRMVVRQLSDETPKIVRCAIQILIDWLPMKATYTNLLKGTNFSLLGESGRLLEALYYGGKTDVTVEDIEELDRIVTFWLDEFIERYVDIVEDEVCQMTLDIKRSMDGRFARSSHTRSDRGALCPPPHIFGTLMRTRAGRQLIRKHAVLPKLLGTLSDFSRWDHFQQRRGQYLTRRSSSVCSYLTEKDGRDDYSSISGSEATHCRRAKGALLAIGHLVGGVVDAEGQSMLHLRDALALCVDYATSCGWLSVRGCAFWALNIAGCSAFGNAVLNEFSWECAQTALRHKRSTSTSPNVKRPPRVVPSWACKAGEKFADRGSHHYSFVARSLRRTYNSRRRRRRHSTGASDSRTPAEDEDSVTHAVKEAGFFERSGYGTTVAATDDYSVLSEAEQQNLAAYRGILNESAGRGDGGDSCDDGKRSTSTNVADGSVAIDGRFAASAGDGCGPRNSELRHPLIHLPRRFYQMNMGIFTGDKNDASHRSSTSKVLTRGSRAGRESGNQRVPKREASRHSALRCLHCQREVMRTAAADCGEPDKRHRSATSDEVAADNNEIFWLCARLANACRGEESAAATQIRLLEIYNESPSAFKNPCLFSDVLHLTAESNLTANQRRFLHHLFWGARL